MLFNSLRFPFFIIRYNLEMVKNQSFSKQWGLQIKDAERLFKRTAAKIKYFLVTVGHVVIIIRHSHYC